MGLVFFKSLGLALKGCLQSSYSPLFGGLGLHSREMFGGGICEKESNGDVISYLNYTHYNDIALSYH